MADKPRSEVFDPDVVGVYHCFNQAVQQRFLFGKDTLSGKDEKAQQKSPTRQRLWRRGLGDVGSFGVGSGGRVAKQLISRVVPRLELCSATTGDSTSRQMNACHCLGVRGLALIVNACIHVRIFIHDECLIRSSNDGRQAQVRSL